MAIVFVAVVFVAIVFVASAAAAQDRVQVGAQVAVARSTEFDHADTGAGARVAVFAHPAFGGEAEINWYPGTLAANPRRTEALFGVTAGPRVGRVRPFAKLRAGVLAFRRHPVACILIFPPPLACEVTAGRSLFALDLGGGVEANVSGRTFVRVDAGDRMLKYPGPSSSRGRVHPAAFYGHDFRFSAGAGVRF